jgi:predicted CoA-binding protein
LLARYLFVLPLLLCQPKRDSVLGIRAYDSIADVPEQVDLAEHKRSNPNRLH